MVRTHTCRQNTPAHKTKEKKTSEDFRISLFTVRYQITAWTFNLYVYMCFYSGCKGEVRSPTRQGFSTDLYPVWIFPISKHTLFSETRCLGPSIPNCCNIYPQVHSQRFPCQPEERTELGDTCYLPRLASQTPPGAWRISLNPSMPGGLHSLAPALLEVQCFHKHSPISSSSNSSLLRLYTAFWEIPPNAGPRDSYHGKKQKLHLQISPIFPAQSQH